MIKITGVSKSYNRGATRAVDGLNLEVRRGEIFGFLGPNGAGKTTTIKMIVGLLRPDSGTISVDGVDALRDHLEAKKRMGYVPDNPDVYERLTGIEYLSFLADVYGVPGNVRSARITELLDTFEMADAVGDLIQSYSHGMRQKLVLIGALLHQPPLLILDEPMVGLDPRSSFLLKEMMRRHCDAGYTVFFSTHILEVAERLCDRIGIIHKGRLVAMGTMEELRGRHAEVDETLEQLFLELTEAKVDNA